MSELNSHEDINTKRQNIIGITPSGEDPVLYWHQVAVDAIHAKLRQDELFALTKQELFELQKDKKTAADQRVVDLQEQSIPSFRELLSQVSNGDFYMTVQLSFYPNGDVKESSHE